ncbi:hypothetical protein L1887_08295 [Cichorium endivia]|nr:hypothetical protein L1887_08295 [Cichorium endivia]
MDSGFEDSTKPDSEDSEEEEEEDDDDDEASVLEFSDSDDMGNKHKFKSMAYKKLKDGIRIEDVTKDHILHYLPAKSLARASREICVDLGISDLISDGVFVNGVVCWEVTGGKLLAFDMKNEIYGVQTLPEGGALSMVHGELCYVKGHYYRHSNKMCVLEVYNGSLMSLKKTMRFCVPFDDVALGDVVGCSVLGNTCDDDIVVILKKAEGRDCLFVYRVKRQKVEGPLLLDSSIKLFPYVNSLVSIAA